MLEGAPTDWNQPFMAQRPRKARKPGWNPSTAFTTAMPSSPADMKRRTLDRSARKPLTNFPTA